MTYARWRTDTGFEDESDISAAAEAGGMSLLIPEEGSQRSAPVADRERQTEAMHAIDREVESAAEAFRARAQEVLRETERGLQRARAPSVKVESARDAAVPNRRDARHGVPASWGGKVRSSAHQPDVDVSLPTSDKVEEVAVDGLARPVFLYGRLAVVPVSTLEDFSSAWGYLRTRRKSARDKSVMVVPKGMRVNASPEVVARLADAGVILVHGETTDPVAGARGYATEFAKQRMSGRENLHAFMRAE